MGQDADRREESHLRFSRRRFLQAAGGVVVAGSLNSPRFAGAQSERSSMVDAFDGDVAAATVAQLQAGMETGSLTSVSITQAYLDRIDDVDRAGPSVNSVLMTNPEALDIAAQLDRERQEQGPRGPLHGVPILLKDNIDTGDRMVTSAGSLALASPAGADATVAARLRQAGCVLLGKTNLSEWANFRSTRSSSGWSGVGGQTKNPHVLNRNPCGSSSGSGAAVAAGLCAAAIGTETDGSIVCPSNANGIVGIKPTLGLVGRTGIVPIAHSQDTAGPMARTVADAAAILTALVGVDPADPITSGDGVQRHPDYTLFCAGGDLAGVRLGVARNYTGFHERADLLLTQALLALAELGAIVVDPAEIPHRGAYDDAEYEVLLYEFKSGLNAYLAGRPELETRTLADLIEFNLAHAETEMPLFRQEIFEKAQEKGDLTEAAYLEALETSKRLAGPDGIDTALQQHGVDALVAITGGPAWPTDPVTGDHFLGGCSSPAAVSGYPHITVPMGTIFGLPVNLSIFGAAFSEPILIRVAHAFEQATRLRAVPRYLPEVDLTQA
ncbi:MAG TPA: amidase [Candidatus Latescibacteria bacterium]|nr:amidase [Candidatus Latescibacterota bacterium]